MSQPQPVTYEAKMVQILANHPDSALSVLAQQMSVASDLVRAPLLTVALGYTQHQVEAWQATRNPAFTPEEFATGVADWPGLDSGVSSRDYALLLFWARCCLQHDQRAWRRYADQLGYRWPTTE